jgi:hypothetical protein
VTFNASLPQSRILPDQEYYMTEAPARERDLALLTRQFIAETCDFLTENWNLRRKWWPLRSGGRGGRQTSTCDVRQVDVPEAPASADVLRVLQVVSMHADAVDVNEIGLAGTHLFVFVPCGGRIGVTGPCTQTVIAQAADELEDGWPIWARETILPPLERVYRPARLPVAK